MILDWAVYVLAISLLVGVAAWLAEQGAKAQRWPTRWIWAAAMAASLGIPLAAWLLPSSSPAPSVMAAPTALVLGSLPALSPAPSTSAGPSAVAVALVAWAALTALLAGLIVVLAARLRLRRRRWTRRTVEGVDVWVSARTGPAALGLLRGHVVVPEWALSLSSERRRLLVLHEAEHVRARDPQLAFAGLVACALVPWALPLWWQLRRLRLAIEMDCDERVLRRAGDARGYGSLLLEVGQRKAAIVGALALAESRSMLERRIRMIAQTTTGRSTFRAVGLAALAGLVLAVACETPGPTGPADSGSNELTVQEARSELGDECSPTWFINGSRSSVGVVDALEPSQIESVNVFNSEQVARSQGVEACGIVAILTKGASPDEAAAARRLVEQLMTEERKAAGQVERRTPTLEEVREEPTFTPMTVRPQLRNAGEVRQALLDNYPPLLRDAGIGGTTNVWFLIDEEGRVARTMINQSSGYDALDQAALRVAGMMEFTPAYNRDQRTPVWIALDIRFESTAGGAGEGADGGAAAAADRAPSQETAAAREVREAGGAREIQEAGAAREIQESVPTNEEAARRERESTLRARDSAPEPTSLGEVGEDGAAAEIGFTPMTERPRLLNNEEVTELLDRYYPPLLKDAGIGGTATVWVFIDETGAVARMQLNRSSGHDALDQAALKLAGAMRFSPAKNRDEVVPVWIALPITFDVEK